MEVERPGGRPVGQRPVRVKAAPRIVEEERQCGDDMKGHKRKH